MRQPDTRLEVYVIKVTLLGTSPLVWRRILVPREITLHHLHRTLQTVMGWTNSHLHQFVVQRQRISDPRSRVGAKVANENRTMLGELIETVGARLLYEYDFGDGWQHELLLEEVLLGDEPFQQTCVAAFANLALERNPCSNVSLVKVAGVLPRDHRAANHNPAASAITLRTAAAHGRHAVLAFD